MLSHDHPASTELVVNAQIASHRSLQSNVIYPVGRSGYSGSSATSTLRPFLVVLNILSIRPLRPIFKHALHLSTPNLFALLKIFIVEHIVADLKVALTCANKRCH